ncbi:hypothetical protein KR044_012978, partial [Drosophila immigrans]
LRFALTLKLLLILLIFIQPGHSYSTQSTPALGFMRDVQEIVDTVRSDISVLAEETKENIEQKIDENQIKVLQHFKNISLLVDQIEQRYANITTKINSSFVDHRLDNETLSYSLESLVYEMQRISDGFPKMKNLESYEVSTLKSFTDARPEDSALGKPLNKAFYSGLVRQLKKYIQQEKAIKYRDFRFCELKTYPRHYIYTLYMDVALTELKAYILIEYSLMMKRVSGEGFLSLERNTFRMNYKWLTENNVILIIKSMDIFHPGIWSCDPPEQIHGVTYDMMTNLLQGYVENVANLNTDGSCSQTCPQYRNTNYAGCYDQEEFCSKQPSCSGRVYNCQFIDSDMSVCQSSENSTRRYEYVEYANGQLLGERKSCQHGINKVESWRRWLIHKCDYCFCLCDQEENSDRYFNLRETKSDIADNKVVTGVRFVKKNRIFHLQIQQGQLMPLGVINESTLEWKPVDDYKITDPNVIAGVDYHMLNYDSRSLNLDTVVRFRKIKYFVTGVGFQLSDGHLNLQVHYSEFDFETGKVQDPDNNGYWHFQSKINRGRVNQENLDVPTRSGGNSQTISDFDQFVDFVNTGIHKDAAQTTIPFFDTQDIVSSYPMPLSGIGLILKGTPGYGGYVSPLIIHYDFSYYFPNVF